MKLAPFEVPVQPLPLEKYRELAGGALTEAILERGAIVRQRFRGRTLWNINSAAAGGGVAEMLPSMLGYAKGQGIDARWLVIDGDERFFAITKRIHNWVHGVPGDGGVLGKEELEHFVAVNAANYEALARRFRPGDAAIVHDPQPAALVPMLVRAGVPVAWRCHIGLDTPNELAHRAWEFLRPFLAPASAICFSRRSYAPSWVDPKLLHVIPPSIDPLVAKNDELDDTTTRRVLAHLGVIADVERHGDQPVVVHRRDGTTFLVERHADILRSGPLPATDAPLVVQVSRWDRLKDMPGVLRGFTEGVDDSLGAHLALVGPAVHAVADDPEGAQSYDLCAAEWRKLPHFKRCRVQLVCLPMADVTENAFMVNAIQRHAAIVVQKSVQEGFGLSVSEAMWKGRAVVGSAVGGIQDQIEDGRDGRLLRDPLDIGAFGAILDELLRDPAQRARLGAAARGKVREKFLPPRHLMQLAAMVLQVMERVTAASAPHP